MTSYIETGHIVCIYPRSYDSQLLFLKVTQQQHQQPHTRFHHVFSSIIYLFVYLFIYFSPLFPVYCLKMFVVALFLVKN